MSETKHNGTGGCPDDCLSCAEFVLGHPVETHERTSAWASVANSMLAFSRAEAQQKANESKDGFVAVSAARLVATVNALDAEHERAETAEERLASISGVTRLELIATRDAAREQLEEALVYNQRAIAETHRKAGVIDQLRATITLQDAALKGVMQQRNGVMDAAINAAGEWARECLGYADTSNLVASIEDAIAKLGVMGGPSMPVVEDIDRLDEAMRQSRQLVRDAVLQEMKQNPRKL